MIYTNQKNDKQILKTEAIKSYLFIALYILMLILLFGIFCYFISQAIIYGLDIAYTSMPWFVVLTSINASILSLWLFSLTLSVFIERIKKKIKIIKKYKENKNI